VVRAISSRTIRDVILTVLTGRGIEVPSDISSEV
jgi:hypothetical protein